MLIVIPCDFTYTSGYGMFRLPGLVHMINRTLKKEGNTLTRVAQLVGCHSATAKGFWFDSWSGHMPGLPVQYLVGVCTRGNRSMFLSHMGVSLPLSLPSTLSKSK